MNRVQKRRAVVFLVSDFLDELPRKTLAISNRRHDLTAITVSDPCEDQVPDVGFVRLRDAETGRSHLQVLDEQDLANYRDVWREHAESLRRYCYHYSIGLTQTEAGVPTEQCLETIMMRAARR